MEGKALERITRIAQNLPVPRTTFKRTTTPEGEVYYAYGKGLNWHGVYGFDGPGGPIARVGSGPRTLTEKQIEETLIIEARKELAVLTCRQ